MPEVDSKLAQSLRQAKTTPMRFVFIAKGSSDGALLVSKSTVPPNDIQEAKKRCGGTTLIRGRCLTENGVLIFEMGKPPPATLAAQLRKVIMRDAGLTFHVETRHAAGLEDEEGAHTEGEGETAPSDAAAFKARLQAVMPTYQRAGQQAPGRKADLDALAARAASAAKGGDFAGGLVLLDQLEAQCRAALTAPPKAPAVSNVVFTQTRLAWDQTRKKIQSELQKLETAILEGCADQDDFDAAGVAAGTKSLYTILDKLDTRLIDKLDEALNAEDAGKRSQLQAEAGKIVQEYLAFVNSDALMAEIDANGFTPVAVRQSAVAALKLLASKL